MVNELVEPICATTTEDRMNVFFVADNQTALNWGRGASLALGELLSGSFDIIGRVSGDLFDLSAADAGYVGTLMPARYYHQFRYMLLRERQRPFCWYIRLERMFGAKDFIDEDPAVSVDNLLAHKHRHPALAQIYDEATKADMLVIDGDGDIIFSTPPRRTTLFVLAMMELGIRLKKPVFLVNSMISDCPITGRNETTLAAARRLFAQCKAVSLRDPESLEYVQTEMPETSSSLIPDSLFAWYPLYNGSSPHLPLNGDFLLANPERDQLGGALDFSRPYICIGGGALAASQPDRSLQSFSHLVDEINKLGMRVYLTENDSGDSFLRRVAKDKDVGIIPANAPIVSCGAILAHARLFISGRYHPSILASLGGTPCIFLGSHAHKMRSISRVLEYETHREFSAFPGESEVTEIVSAARNYLDRDEALRARIRQAAKRRWDEAVCLPEFLKRHMNELRVQSRAIQ